MTIQEDTLSLSLENKSIKEQGLEQILEEQTEQMSHIGDEDEKMSSEKESVDDKVVEEVCAVAKTVTLMMDQHEDNLNMQPKVGVVESEDDSLEDEDEKDPMEILKILIKFKKCPYEDPLITLLVRDYKVEVKCKMF